MAKENLRIGLVDDKSNKIRKNSLKEQCNEAESCCHCCGLPSTDVGGTLLRCKTCKKMCYCSLQCFTDHLPKHREVCQTASVLERIIAVYPSADEKCEKEMKDGKRSDKSTPKASRKKKLIVKRIYVDASCSESETETESMAAERRRTPKTKKKPSVAAAKAASSETSESEGEVVTIQGPQLVTERPLGRQKCRRQFRGRKRDENTNVHSSTSANRKSDDNDETSDSDDDFRASGKLQRARRYSARRQSRLPSSDEKQNHQETDVVSSDS